MAPESKISRLGEQFEEEREWRADAKKEILGFLKPVYERRNTKIQDHVLFKGLDAQPTGFSTY